MRTSLFIFLCGTFIGGCSPKSSDTASNPPPPSTNGALDEVKAIAVARAAVATNDSWDQAIFKATRKGLGWSVWVWREPRKPGSDRTVLIDEKGRVTAYYRGE